MANTHPEQHEIEKRAYEFYCERGCQHGKDLEDWNRAERELTEQKVRRSEQQTERRGNQPVAFPSPDKRNQASQTASHGGTPLTERQKPGPETTPATQQKAAVAGRKQS